MAHIALEKRGERKVKLRLKNPLNLSSIEVIDVESGQSLDNVVGVEFPRYEQGRLYWARVTLLVTDIEVVPVLVEPDKQTS